MSFVRVSVPLSVFVSDYNSESVFHFDPNLYVRVCFRSVFVPFSFRFRSVFVPFSLRFRSVFVPFPFRFRSVSVPFPFRFRSVSVPFPFRFRYRHTYCLVSFRLIPSLVLREPRGQD